MSYTQLNADVFTAAFSGATAGMGVSGRIITDGDSSRYDGLIAIANAYAEEFDTLWGGTAIGFLELEIILEASQDIWSERAPVPSPTTLDPNTYRPECEAIIALLNNALDFYADNGYTNPPLGGGGTTVVPLPNVRYVDPDSTTGTEDGSIANPYLTVQAAFDDLVGGSSDRFTIIITPQASGNAGDLDIPNTFDGSLNIRGECGAQNSLENEFESTSFGIGAVMGSITCEPNALGNLRVTIENIFCNGVVATGGEEDNPNPVRFMFTDSQVINIDIPAGRAFGQRSTFRTLTCVDYTFREMQANIISGGIIIVAANGGTMDMASLNSLLAGNVDLSNASPTISDAPQVAMNVIVVDPANVGISRASIVKTGAYAGALSFATLQDAYDATLATATTPVFVCYPGDVGALTMSTGDARAIFIRAQASDELDVISQIGAIQIANACLGLTIIDSTVIGNITEEGGGDHFIHSLQLTNTGVGGEVNLPSSTVNIEKQGITGDITCNVFRSKSLTQGPANLTATNRISWDANSEFTYFTALNNDGSNIPNATFLSRIDDAAASAQIGPDSAFTIDGATNQRKVCQPGQLTANRIWKLDNSDDSNHGYVIDVWRQDFALSVGDEDDATLITIPAGSDPVRLFFFATGAGNFKLINMQSLLQLS